MIVELLSNFKPEPDALLREIAQHVDDEMLEWIAEADYGQDREKHLIALRQIRDLGTFPKEMLLYPAEVLELIRNSPAESPGWPSGRDWHFGHWARAFCCAALLRATREPYNYGDRVNTENTLIKLIFSLRALPEDLNQEAVRFLAWLLLHADPEGRDEQVCAYGIGLFWFGLHLSIPLPDDALISLAEWIARRSDEFNLERVSRNAAFLLKMGIDDPPPSPWESLGIALFDLDLSNRSPVLQKWAGVIGKELAGDG